MKNFAIKHPKMILLASRLRIPMNHARGIMEMLWYFTAQSAPRGDIGKFTDDLIQQEVAPELKNVRLIEVLLDLKWLDAVDGPERLYIHDWHEHAPDSVKRYLSRANTTFANGFAPYGALAKRVKNDQGQAVTGQDNGNVGTVTGQCRDGDGTMSGQKPDNVGTVTGQCRDGDGIRARASTPAPTPTPEREGRLSRWIEMVKRVRREFLGFPADKVGQVLMVEAEDEVIESAVRDFCQAMDPATCLKLPPNPVMTLGRFVQEACRRAAAKKEGGGGGKVDLLAVPEGWVGE